MWYQNGGQKVPKPGTKTGRLPAAAASLVQHFRQVSLRMR